MWDIRLRKVAKNPGVWHRVFQGSPSGVHVIASHLRKGEKYNLPKLDGKFEFTGRTVDGRGRVYARYIPKAVLDIIDGVKAVA